MVVRAPARDERGWKRRLASISRWLHIYLSMLSFSGLLFFAVTGITLNHQDWFSGQQRTQRYQGRVDTKWVKTPDANVGKLEIVEFLRRTHGVKAALNDFHVDESRCEVSFKGPGYEADAFIDRQTGQYEMNESRMGMVAMVNDLHKGRDSGTEWSAAIDVSAGLMACVSLTGMILIFFLPRRRASGLLALGTGALVLYLVYAIWVR